VTFQGNQGSGGFGQPADQTLRVNGVDIRTNVDAQGRYLTQAFFWMFAGLLLTAAVAALVQFNPAILQFVANNFLVIVIAQFALVMVISFGISRLNATLALGLFFVYAASLGFTVIALVMQVYTAASIATAFISASAMFGGAALYGYTTKRSLAGIGRYLTMAVFGLVAAIIVNLILGNGVVDLIISIIGVGLFTVLTAYHVQRIASGDLAVAAWSVEKAAVLGALLLYLDFVNIFLFLLRLFGDRR
jgi:FtsH-binding integral membrane protein